MKAVHVLSISESLDFVLEHFSSVARFGDGEVDIMMGRSIPYQKYDPALAAFLKQILLTPSNSQLMVCLPDVFEHLERYNQSAKSFWHHHFNQYSSFYDKYCQSDWYGSTFISRPYIDLKDKTEAKSSFQKLKKLWDRRDILIVEGETSRSGVGNDLFDNAASISRIICPSKDAFEQRSAIYNAIKRHAKGKLILLMLGPTAKVLAYDLSQEGYQAIDIGHIDSEYEWFKMGATHKVKLANKHTAEFNYDKDIVFDDDTSYSSQILEKVSLSGDEDKVEMIKLDKNKETISVIVPVYNVAPYLKRCIDSILKQTHTDFELLLINDGSTDGSVSICQEYVEKDSRIHLYHQSNKGVSAARNLGIDKANGNYITFIDSDDFVEDIYLEKLYKALRDNGSDISAVNFSSFNEERQSFLFFITSENYFEKNYNRQEWLDQENMARHNLYMAFTFSPLKLFKKELFEGIRFPLGRLREDDATIYKLYLKADQITFVNAGLYYYSQRQDGLSRTRMLDDIASMISNAEERIALLASMGFDVTEHVASYIARLKKCQTDSLQAGQIELYQELSAKLDLINHYQNQEGQ